MKLTNIDSPTPDIPSRDLGVGCLFLWSPRTTGELGLYRKTRIAEKAYAANISGPGVERLNGSEKVIPVVVEEIRYRIG